MAERAVYLTSEGARKLKVELDELRGTKRVELAKRLRHAVQQGDLSENAAYQMAIEDADTCRVRIEEVKKIIRELEKGEK